MKTNNKIRNIPRTERGIKADPQKARHDWFREHIAQLGPGHVFNPVINPRRLVHEFTVSDVEFWIESELSHLSNKAVNEVLIIARGVFKRACREMRRHNPFDDIDNKTVIRREADPFSRDEIERILSTDTRYQGELNMLRAAIWSGLSLEEYFALAWEDIDLDQWTIRVRRAKVDDVWKVPKTARRERIIELVDPAIEAFRRQKELTYLRQPIEVETLQRDNKTRLAENITPVFLNTNTEKPHSYSPFVRWYRSHLKRAKVPYRGPNNCRHTFASQMLTLGVSVEWIIYQMGHTSDRMFRQHYAKWIRQDAPQMARLVSDLLRDTDAASN